MIMGIGTPRTNKMMDRISNLQESTQISSISVVRLNHGHMIALSAANRAGIAGTERSAKKRYE